MGLGLGFITCACWATKACVHNPSCNTTLKIQLGRHLRTKQRIAHKMAEPQSPRIVRKWCLLLVPALSSLGQRDDFLHHRHAGLRHDLPRTRLIILIATELRARGDRTARAEVLGPRISLDWGWSKDVKKLNCRTKSSQACQQLPCPPLHCIAYPVRATRAARPPQVCQLRSSSRISRHQPWSGTR